MSILSAILLFGFLIFIHELGHFIVAKINGVKVLKFSLGFGPALIGRKIGETEYVLSAIPLGGYVKMLGQEDVGEVGDAEDAAEKGRSYRYQPILKRALIVLAGPLFNILTATVIFFFIYLAGVPTLLPVVGEIVPDSPAAKASLRQGDRVLEINGTPVKQWTDMTDIIYANALKTISMKVQRNSELLAVTVTPESKKIKDIFGEEREVGLIGVKPSGETVTVQENVPNALKGAVVKTWDVSALTLVGIVKLIQRIVPADTIGGPILIFQLAEKQATAGALSYFLFAAVISINLGILNLLPIPVLDGGHLFFLGIEAIRRKPLSDRTVQIAQRVGLALLLLLMAFAMYNDIFRLFTGKPLP
ncbi:MAG: RIP metalloprotease RseP [Alphaproteobacteria bacterium]|uniref:Zinc metalloprotease n=1 Tax=Candidatus Nitrobium versatile TaxID=2884831 RepID=A0A953J4T3_9BACT|nr:RIP metalloprotease RseP [Candidatus Nitrobium versatile]